MFDPPIRKKDVYVSRIRTSKGRPVRISGNNTRFLGMHRLDEDQGYLIKIGFPKDSTALEKLGQWDQLAFQNTIRHFTDWFPHSEMTDEQLHTYFRTSVTTPSCVTIMASTTQEPLQIQLDDMDVTMGQLFQIERDVLRGLYCHLEMEAQGLYFHPKRFGIRWVLRKIILSRTRTEHATEEDILPSMMEKAAIEEQWMRDVADMCDQMEKNIEMHRQQIASLEQDKADLQKWMEMARATPKMDPVWNESLENVRSKIAFYQRQSN